LNVIDGIGVTGSWGQERLDKIASQRRARQMIAVGRGCIDWNIQNIVYEVCMGDLKPLEFRGDSLEVLRGFPEPVRKRAGQELLRLQLGREPRDWKPMATVGSGVSEIRIRDEQGIFRVIYAAKFAEAVFVPHCFQKKTQKTTRTGLDIAARRYRELAKEP
jgi:phage-related protein